MIGGKQDEMVNSEDEWCSQSHKYVLKTAKNEKGGISRLSTRDGS